MPNFSAIICVYLKSLLYVTFQKFYVFVGQNGYFLDGGRHDERFALVQEYALSVGVEEAALAAETHIDAETVDASIVAFEGLCKFHFVGCEEGALHEAYDCVAFFFVNNFWVGGDVFEVDGIECKFGVQFAEVSVAVTTQIVVDAIGLFAEFLR